MNATVTSAEIRKATGLSQKTLTRAGTRVATSPNPRSVSIPPVVARWAITRNMCSHWFAASSRSKRKGSP